MVDSGLPVGRATRTRNRDRIRRTASLVSIRPPPSARDGIALRVACYDTREMHSRPAPEERLAELARARGPLRRVVAAVAGRMVACRGWEPLGYARPSDYARERLGVSASSLQEWARVDGRLAGLPELEAALVSGALPWSKVRLLARFAAPENESSCIAHAGSRSVRVLEREIRAVDRGALETGGLDLDEEGCSRESMERVRIAGPPTLCLGWQRVREYAARESGQRLTPGAVLEMVTAEALSALPLDAEAQEDLESRGGEASARGHAEPEPRRRPDAPEPERRADEVEGPEPAQLSDAGQLASEPLPRSHLPRFLRSLVAGLEGAGPFELDARLRRAVRLEQRLDAAIGPLLRQVSSAEYEWGHDYLTLAEYVREYLGMSPRKARALLRLERLGDACPELRGAYRNGAISWLQAQTLAPLLLRESTQDRPWRGAWLDFTRRITLRRLEELVDHATALRETDPAAWARLQHAPEELARSLEGEAVGERQVCVQPAPAEATWHLAIRAPTDVARLFRAVLCTLRRALERETGRLPSEGEAFQAMLDHALREWGVNDPWLARWAKRVSSVFERDDWRCTVPGCSSRRNLHAHHIVFRSLGGGDEPENLTTLCAFHHQRGVHGGVITVRGRAPHALTYEVGLRPGLPPLARYRSGDLAA